MSRLRRRPSPALVVACLALAVALGGTGYAAIVLPANSVGTKQLRNGAVIASKVKPHSLLASSFKRGQVPAGPPGPKGADGLAGAAGAAGPKGDKGDAATKLFAVVGASGSLIKSSGVMTLVKPATGRYELTFNQDVSGCASLATPGSAGSLPDGEAAAASTPPPGAKVTVRTFDSTGADDDLGFTLAVFC